jgi:hypothetical protein
MRNDRLRRDADEIHNPDDLIEARSEGTSHISDDVDAFEEDLDMSEEIDVDHALTFPHPKDRHGREKEGDSTGIPDERPNELDTDENWDAQDIQPSDYEHEYEEATDTHATDDMDEVMEEVVHEIGWVMPMQVRDEEPTELMPTNFEPDEETA